MEAIGSNCPDRVANHLADRLSRRSQPRRGVSLVNPTGVKLCTGAFSAPAINRVLSVKWAAAPASAEKTTERVVGSTRAWG